MSVETSTAGGPPSPHNPTVWILAVTVIVIVAIVVIALAGHAVVAAVISGVWATTCGVLGYKKP